MSEEAKIAVQVVDESAKIWSFVEGAGTGLGTFLLGAWPVVSWWLKRQKVKQAEKEAAIEEEKRKAPKYLEVDLFKKFESENRSQHDELGRIVHNAAVEASNAAQSVIETSRQIRADQESHAKEQRELLVAFQIGINQSLREVHEKANEAKLEVAAHEGRIEALEKRPA